MKIHLLESADWPDDQLKDKLTNVIAKAYKDANTIIPKANKYINIIVQPDSYSCIPETGDGGVTINSELIKIAFDEKLPYGEKALLKDIRATVFHEYNHASRYFSTEYDASLLNHAITEGLATVFERDYSDSREPLWGKYEPDAIMQAWYKEVVALNDDWSKKDDYTFSHSDGRRWIMYKLGTWLVDRASKNSGKTIAELTALASAKIVVLAKIGKA